MVCRLLVSKNLEHVREGIRFIDSCLKSDGDRFVYVAINAIKIVHQQANQAMLYICQYLICRVYLALLNKYTGKKYESKFKLKMKFPQVGDQIAKQKDNAIVIAQMHIRFAGEQMSPAQVEEYLFGLMPKRVDYFNDVLTLVKLLIERLNSPLKPAKVVALNTLSTLCTFICFSSKNMLNQLISRGQIDRQLKNFDDNALAKDQKYLCAVEARAVACRAFIDNAPQLVSATSVPVIQGFLQWVLPNTTRTDFKNAAIYLLKCVYNFDEKMPQWCAKTLNKCVPNATLLKTIAQELVQEDAGQGRAPQV